MARGGATARLLPVALLLAGCAAAAVPEDSAGRSARQEAACAAAVAEHVGKPRAAVSTRFRAEPEGGVAAVEARDAGRLHVCAGDAAGRVLRIEHPGA